MWFVYMHILCRSVLFNALYTLKHICFLQVKGVETSACCVKLNRRQKTFHQSLLLMVECATVG